MSRTFNGSTQYGSLAKNILGGADTFTIACWFKPTTLSGTQSDVILSSGTTNSYWQLEWDANVADAVSLGIHTGSFVLQDATGIVLNATDVANGAWIAYRKLPGTSELSRWKNGTKGVVSASSSLTMPAGAAVFRVAELVVSSFPLTGTLAEVAIWNLALSDGQMAEIQNGVAADAVCKAGLQVYLPLRGNSSPELNYIIPADVLTLTGSPPQSTHPTIIPPKHADDVFSSWVVDLLHTDDPIKAATRDLSDYLDVDTIGGFYPGILADDITITEELPDIGAGVMIPGSTVISILNTDSTITHGQEWRGVPVKVRYYDARCHCLTTEFVGVIDDVNIANNRAVFTCSSQDAAILDQLIPRQVIEVNDGATGVIDDVEGNDVRTDVGAPIPIVCGTGGLMSPPYIGVGDGSVDDLIGGDLLVGFGGANTVRKLWWDWDSHTPGFEPGAVWDAVPGGTPTYVSSSAFGVTGVYLDERLAAGMPVRHSDNAGTTWDYSHIASNNIGTAAGGTVTLAHAIVTNPIGTVQIAGDFAVENSRYSYVGTGGTTALTTVRFFASTTSAVMVEAGETSRRNPADAIKFILNDPDLGLGQEVNTTAFTAAATTFTNVGLGSAIRGVIGGDKVQRRALDVLNEMAMLRGARIWKDADTEQWTIEVDEAATESTDTLEFGESLKGNIASVGQITRTPRPQSIATLKFRYSKGGRDRGGKGLEQVDYAHTALATVNAIGKERVIASPWIRATSSHLEAARVCYYWAKRLAAEDRTIPFEMTDHWGRRIDLGSVYTMAVKTSPGVTLGGSYRITKRQRTLTRFTFAAQGPYSSATYSTDSGTINAAVATPSADVNPDERETGTAGDANLLMFSDFTADVRHAVPQDVLDPDTIPGWWISVAATSDVVSISSPETPQAKGGAYLEIVTAAGIANPVTLLSADSVTGFKGGISVSAGQNYLLSIYSNRTSAWRMGIQWRNQSGLVAFATPTIRPMPGDVDGLGHGRYYGVASCPADATFAVVTFTLAGGASQLTYRFNAVQFEQVTRLSVRPTPWKRHTAYGVEPTQILPGELFARAVRSAQLGTGFSIGGGTVPIGLSGGTVTVGTADVGLVTGFTAYVSAGISGCTSWALKLNHGGGTTTTLAAGLGTAVGSTAGDADLQISPPVTFHTATPIIAVPYAGGTTFTGGTVKVAVHRMRHIAPT